MKGSVNDLKGSLIGFILSPVVDGLAVVGMSDGDEMADFWHAFAGACTALVVPGLACGAVSIALAIIEETQALKTKPPNKVRNVIIRRKGFLFMAVAPFEFLKRVS